MGKALDIALPIAAAVFAPELLPATFGAWAAPIGAGLATTGLGLAHGEGLGRSLEHGTLSAGGSYLGSQIGSSLFGSPSTGVTSAVAPTGAGSISGAGSIGGLGGDSLGAQTGGFTGGASDISAGLGGSPSITSSFTPGAAGSTLASGAGQAAAQSASPSIFSSFRGPDLGTVGSNINALTGPSAGNAINNFIGQGAADTGAGAAIGSTIGSQLAQGLAGPSKSPPGWTPSQSAASSLPPSLSSLSALNPTQQTSNLATQGTYGGGLGPQEQSYYANLLNRQLVDQSGNVSPLSSLSPIEQTYNQQLGFGGNKNSTDLLRQLSTWSPQ